MPAGKRVPLPAVYKAGSVKFVQRDSGRARRAGTAFVVPSKASQDKTRQEVTRRYSCVSLILHSTIRDFYLNLNVGIIHSTMCKVYWVI